MDEYGDILVVGDDQSAVEKPPRRPTLRRLVVVGCGLLAAVVWTLTSLGDTESAESRPAGLEAPTDPIEPAEEEAFRGSALGDSWTPLALRSDGYVTSVTHGAGGWLVVTNGNGVQVYTSHDAVTWKPHVLPTGSAMRLTWTAVAGETMVVAGTDVADSVGWTWISRDGSDWRKVPLSDEPVTLSSVVEVDGTIYATGRVVFPSMGNRGAGGGIAAAWRLDGDAWTELSFSEEPGPHSAVASVVDSAGSTMAIGSDIAGLAVWRIAGDTLVPMGTTGGEGARPVSVTQTPDGRTLAIGYGRVAAFVSDDLIDWSPSESTAHWRYAVVEEDDQVAAGYDYISIQDDGEESRTEVSMGLISDIAGDRNGVIVLAGASTDDHAGVLWINGVPEQPVVATSG